MSKNTWIIVTVVIVALLGWGGFAFIKKDKPIGEDLSVFYPMQNREHIEVGTEHPAYSSNPPSSGWHYEVTGKKQFYGEVAPDEYLIHNMEHGDVWIAYHPRVSDTVKKELKQFAFNKVVITPRTENDTDIALVAWERVDKFNLEGDVVPESRIRDFIKRYRNQGPERIPAGAIEATFN